MADLDYFNKQIIKVLDIVATAEDIENKALDGSLMSLFRKKNFADYISILENSKIKLRKITYSPIPSSFFDEDDDGTLDAILENKFDLFTGQVIGYIDALAGICNGLNSKSIGQQYSMDAYQLDFQKVKTSKTSYLMAQSNLFK